jgi:hypothetical protein
VRGHPRLSIVIPHWPLDEEVDAALRKCLASLPIDCEKIIVVNQGTGFAPNVNRGLTLASGEFIGVVGNDTVVTEGDVYDLCEPGTVTRPLVEEKASIDPGGFHGAFWVMPKEVLDSVGFLDERFEGGFYEDDDFLQRLKVADIPVRQITTVRAWSRPRGLTMSKLEPAEVERLVEENERRFAEKWGWTPPRL